MICDKRMISHYRDYILSGKIILECCKASVYTKPEECYKLFCCMNTFDEYETFNDECQVLMTEICISFENSIAASSTSGKKQIHVKHHFSINYTTFQKGINSNRKDFLFSRFHKVKL